MTSTVDAVDLKHAAAHDVRYTVAVLHVREAVGDSVRCWVGVCHWDTETLTLKARHSHTLCVWEYDSRTLKCLHSRVSIKKKYVINN